MWRSHIHRRHSRVLESLSPLRPSRSLGRSQTHGDRPMTTFSELDTFEPASHDGFLALLPAICDGDRYAMRGLWAHKQVGPTSPTPRHWVPVELPEQSYRSTTVRPKRRFKDRIVASLEFAEQDTSVVAKRSDGQGWKVKPVRPFRPQRSKSASPTARSTAILFFCDCDSAALVALQIAEY